MNIKVSWNTKFFLILINFSEYNKKISLNMKIFSNTKKFTEYKTSFEYENISLNIIKFSLSMKVSLWILKFFSEYKTEAVSRRHSIRKVFLEISQNPQENTCARAYNFNKKETLAQVFSCEFWEISKNTCFL